MQRARVAAGAGGGRGFVGGLRAGAGGSPAVAAAPPPVGAAAPWKPVLAPGVVLLAAGAAVLGAVGALGGFLWLYIRPTLQAFQQACREVEKASLAAESAAEEVERASLMLQAEVPRAADATEAAGRGVEQLSEELSGSVEWLRGTATELPQVVQETLGAAQRGVGSTVIGFAGPWQGSVQEIATGVVAEAQKWQQGLAAAVATFEKVQKAEVLGQSDARGSLPAAEGQDPEEEMRMSLAEEAVEDALAAAQVAADAAEAASEDLVKAVVDFEEIKTGKISRK